MLKKVRGKNTGEDRVDRIGYSPTHAILVTDELSIKGVIGIVPIYGKKEDVPDSENTDIRKITLKNVPEGY